jgi:type II secretory pathway pseudopilin PulG
MGYPVVAAIDWASVRDWIEALAALIAAIGTVLAFYFTYQSAQAQREALRVQAAQLKLQQEQIDNERGERVASENRNRRSTIVAAIQEIDRNMNTLSEPTHEPLENGYLRNAYHLMLDHGPENLAHSLRVALDAVDDFSNWAINHRTRAFKEDAFNRVNTVTASMGDALSILKNMEMSIGKPDAQPYHWD